MNKPIAILYAISCFSTSWISGKLLGVGMWFWIIGASGVVVAISQYFSTTRVLGSIVAGFLGIVSVGAISLGLTAATTGGSFKLADTELLLLLSFFFIAVFGFTLVRINKNLK